MAAVARQILARAVSVSKLSGQLSQLSLSNVSAAKFSSATCKPLVTSGILKCPASVPDPAKSSTNLLALCSRFTVSSLNQQQRRHKTYFSYETGGPLNVNEATERFFRLGNGMWIRTRAGRNKRKYTKSARRLSRLQEHVFCTRRQCQMLDKMADRKYKEMKYYIKDPYEHYHKRSMLPIFRTKARPFYP